MPRPVLTADPPADMQLVRGRGPNRAHNSVTLLHWTDQNVVLGLRGGDPACLLQVLPFAGEETLQQLETNLASMPSVTELLHQGLGPKAITEKLLAGIGVSPRATSMQPR